MSTLALTNAPLERDHLSHCLTVHRSISRIFEGWPARSSRSESTSSNMSVQRSYSGYLKHTIWVKIRIPQLSGASLVPLESGDTNVQVEIWVFWLIFYVFVFVNELRITRFVTSLWKSIETWFRYRHDYVFIKNFQVATRKYKRLIYTGVHSGVAFKGLLLSCYSPAAFLSFIFLNIACISALLISLLKKTYYKLL